MYYYIIIEFTDDNDDIVEHAIPTRRGRKPQRNIKSV